MALRVASLLPSATEIVCALGLGDSLVAVSHECDYPPEVVSRLPRLTRSALPEGLSQAEIDAEVSLRLRRGESLYSVDEALLGRLQPDVVITQELCQVCAVDSGLVRAAAARLPARPRILSLQPSGLEGVCNDILAVADALGVADRGVSLAAGLQARLAALDKLVEAHLPSRPRVFAMEWIDPPFAAGHWVPEMVWRAGGAEVLGRPGQPSFRVGWAEIAAARPEVILLIPCGLSREQAWEAWLAAPKPAGVDRIPAIRDARVHPLDANSYCSRPSPRLVDGIAAMLRLLHPDIAARICP